MGMPVRPGAMNFEIAVVHQAAHSLPADVGPAAGFLAELADFRIAFLRLKSEVMQAASVLIHPFFLRAGLQRLNELEFHAESLGDRDPDGGLRIGHAVESHPVRRGIVDLPAADPEILLVESDHFIHVLNKKTNLKMLFDFDSHFSVFLSFYYQYIGLST